MLHPTPDHAIFSSAAMWIGGQHRKVGSLGEMSHYNPSTGRLLGTFPVGGPEEADAAIRAGKAALFEWSSRHPVERRDILLRAAQVIRERAEELARVCAHETGGPFSPAQYVEATEQLTYYAGWADKVEGGVTPLGPGVFNYTLHEPYGVVVGITSWNGPVISALMKLGPALAAGNCMIVKPPELGPFGTLLLAQMFKEAGLPDGVFNVVLGGPEIAQALVQDPRVGKISFTGGLATARHILRGAAENATPVVTELGGKSANLVFADADLDKAAMMASTMGCLAHAGQGCLFPTRLLVEESIYDTMVERVLALVSMIPTGDPFSPGVIGGPVISQGAVDRIMGRIEDAVAKGDGTLLTGGKRKGGDLADGYFIEPTVFGDVDNKSRLAQEEVFGPVLSIIRFKDEDDAIEKANDTSYGLAGYVHTRDLARAHRVASRLEAGFIGVNAFPPMPVQVPFGGYKQSGSGREGGKVGIEEYLRLKNVYMAL